MHVVCSFDTSECRLKADIVFILDSSGSIGEANYEIMKDFVQNFTSELIIGPDDTQVGVVIYGNMAETVFDLNNNMTNLQDQISNIEYLGGGTNTAGGLMEMIRIFNRSMGARSDDFTVLRLAIVITDGRANQGDPVEVAAEHVKLVKPQVLVFAIGVANAVPEELMLIATRPEYVNYLDSFNDASALGDIATQQTFEACFRGR